MRANHAAGGIGIELIALCYCRVITLTEASKSDYIQLVN
jgi:hypothetical protein